jgi:transposase
MRETREILRLKTAGLSHRQISDVVQRSPSVVSEALGRCRAAGLTWPLPPELDNDVALEAKLYRTAENPPSDHTLPDWWYVNREMRRKGVTLLLLWEEYRQEHDDGFQYSWFCEHYQTYRRRLDPVMRQEHIFGEKCFTDYAGPTVPIVNPQTGEVRDASIFVGVLGASNYTYADASWSQAIPCWLRSHVRMFDYFGGVTALEVPDNLKAAVRKSDTYEPLLNETFLDFSNHYEYAILPARKRKPKDKAKVENAVLVVERWILAVLRNRTFYSLDELNEAIAELLQKLNDRPFKKLKGQSRRSLFEAHERHLLHKLPDTPYIIGVWRKATVNIDYHVEVDDHYYSVPYRLIGQKLLIRLSDATVEAYHENIRVASHVRSYYKGKHTTLAEHMPPKHRHHAKWTPERLVEWAQKTGESTADVVDNIMKRKQHPQQGFRACLGVLRLGERFGLDRLEQACRRAAKTGGYSYHHVLSILEHNLDRQPEPEIPAPAPTRPTEHENLRGRDYYASLN